MQNTNNIPQAMSPESVHQVCQLLWNAGQIKRYSVERSELTGETLAHVQDVTGEEFYIETNLHGVWYNRGQEVDTMDPHYGPGNTPERAANTIAEAIRQG